MTVVQVSGFSCVTYKLAAIVMSFIETAYIYIHLLQDSEGDKKITQEKFYSPQEYFIYRFLGGIIKQ